jgi:glucosamine-6-phosphate deaminase
MSEFRYELAEFIPFQDLAECERVRAITKEQITQHANPDFQIRIIEDIDDQNRAFALDIVTRIKAARDDGKEIVIIFPVGPMGQYAIAADVINAMGLPLDHVHSFNMDEYADQDGNTAPADWAGSFQRSMMESFYGKIDERLRPPMNQIHFPTTDVINDYGAMIADLGGADVCYGGVGWCGHIAFWEADLGLEFGDDIEAFKQAGPRLVKLHPITIMQNALHSFNGDWSWVPPKANTIGPAEIMGAKHRSFWLDGALGEDSWQKFIARLAAHGRVNTLVPASLLQTARTDYTILGKVAENVEIHMS